MARIYEKVSSLSTRALNVAGVDRAGAPEIRTPNTRVFWVSAESAALARRYEKGSSLSTRALNVAGVERFELPTRGFGIRCSANWSYTPVVVLKT